MYTVHASATAEPTCIKFKLIFDVEGRIFSVQILAKDVLKRVLKPATGPQKQNDP
jgi:hypothetical protein